MTLDRTETGTARYKAPSAAEASADVFGLSSASQIGAYQQQRLGAPKFEWLPSSQKKGTRRWRYTIYDLRGGLNKTRGPIQDATPYFGNPKGAHNSLADSTMDFRFAEHGILPLLTTSQSTPDPHLPGSANESIWWANVLSELIIGIGDGNGTCLYIETSATDPTIVASPFDGGSGPITCMAPIVLGGVASPPQLLVSSGGGSKLLGTVTSGAATAAGTLHANLANIYGAIQTFVDGGLILFYAWGGGARGIKTLNQSNAITDAPTIALADVKMGGYAVGLLSLAGAPIRAYWVFPKKDLLGAPSMLSFGQESDGELWSTNVRGTDPQQVSIVNSMLPQLRLVEAYRSGVIATDKTRIVYHNGRETRDLHIFTDRKANSDRLLNIRGWWVKNGTDLYVQVIEKASASGSGNTKSWTEYYDFDLDSWQRVAGTLTLSTTGDQGYLGRSLPASPYTGYLHNYADGSWRRQPQTAPGVNPFSQRQTAGAGASTGLPFEASGTFETPVLIFPDEIAYMPKVIDRIACLGDLDAGGVGAYCDISVGGVERRFTVPSNGVLPKRGRYQDIPNNQNRFLTTNIAGSVARIASNTRVTPQVLPIVIEGTAFTDEHAERKFLWF